MISDLEQVRLLLELLYPVALVVAGIVSAALSMLFLLQSAKTASILRALGAPKKAVRVMLCAEQLGVFLSGILLGLLAAAILGWGFGALSVLAAAGQFFSGAILGAILGALIVSGRAPLDLLQVRE